MTLTEFILARIAEDEAEAKRAGADAMVGARWKHYPEDAYIEVQSLTLARSRRVLAECAALREVVEIATKTIRAADAHYEGPDYYGGVDACEDVLRALAAIWSSHEDYRPEEWA